MRVALSVPSPARLTTGPLLVSSTDDDMLLDTLAKRDAEDPVLGPRSNARTHDGWPFTMVRACTATGERVAAMYRFGAWRGYVLVELDGASNDASMGVSNGEANGASNGEANGASVADIIAALSTASPDWRGDGEVHCIAELFE
ncbi:MAG: hypothetical protein ACKV2T_41280 [Kofleriaceae bacterium]